MPSAIRSLASRSVSLEETAGVPAGIGPSPLVVEVSARSRAER